MVKFDLLVPLLVWIGLSESLEEQWLLKDPPCNMQNPVNPECDVYDISADTFKQSSWVGNYTCASDNSMMNFWLSITKSSLDQADLEANMYINNGNVIMSGSFTSAFSILTLEHNDLVRQNIFGRNVTNVQLYGLLQSQAHVDGYITFVHENVRYTCPMEMRRNQILSLENAIRPGCTSYGWNISVNLSILKQLYPTISTSHVYFGDTSCHGRMNGTALIFQQGFRDCLTAERVSKDTFIYENILFYATYDPSHPFIIRQHNWTVAVECDVSRAEATAFHVHHVVDSHHVAATGHYNVSTSFYKDSNFMEQIAGNPVLSSIGDNIYIKVFTTINDWTIKMRLHTCYTKPNDAVDDNLTYFIIKDGCEVDSTTHIISQTTHETRFFFQNFEYSSNREGLNVFCNATFCETSDHSAACVQSCQ